ncbi:MAG: BON domain-containing protein [Deltaproteobacteria bacterium]|nr:BON domain-containing protein [Deltaproteobacteria bacterium]
MENTPRVVGYGVRVAIMTVIVSISPGCSQHHNDRVVSSTAGASVASPQGAHASAGVGYDHGRNGATESERVRASNHNPDARRPYSHEATGASLHGAAANHELASHVKRTLAANKQTRSLHVGVQAHAGVITLTGRVHTGSQKRHAGEVAHKVVGVKRVHNAIKVGSASHP